MRCGVKSVFLSTNLENVLDLIVLCNALNWSRHVIPFKECHHAHLTSRYCREHISYQICGKKNIHLKTPLSNILMEIKLKSKTMLIHIWIDCLRSIISMTLCHFIFLFISLFIFLLPITILNLFIYSFKIHDQSTSIIDGSTDLK